MNKLRFYIAQHNLDMNKIIVRIGFGSGKDEITFNDYHRFFRMVYPSITLS